MRSLIVNMEAEQGGKLLGFKVSFRKIESANGRHITTCMISSDRDTEGRFTRHVGDGATLGKRDAEERRYDFIAGCRIALRKALARARDFGYPSVWVRTLRHAVQIELSIIENDRNGREARRKFDALVRQRDVLQGLKRGLIYTPPPPSFDEVMASINRQRAQDAAKLVDKLFGGSSPSAVIVDEPNPIPPECSECQGKLKGE